MRMIAFLCAAAAAFAQVPNRPNPPVQPRPAGQGMQPMVPGQRQQFEPPQDLSGLKTYLNLTDEQAEQIRRAREQASRQADEKIRTLEPQIREKRNALEDLFAKNTTDAAAVGRLMLDIRALEKQVREARQSVRTSELNVLTPEQRTKFRAVEEAAALPQAAREAVALGLVEGPAPRPVLRPGQGMRNPPQPPMPLNPGQPPRD